MCSVLLPRFTRVIELLELKEDGQGDREFEEQLSQNLEKEKIVLKEHVKVFKFGKE